jgi:hypothetical protein
MLAGVEVWISFSGIFGWFSQSQTSSVMALNSVTTLSEFLSVDYSTFYPSNSFYSYFSHPIIPFTAVIAYLLFSKIIFQTIQQTFKLESRGPVIQTITILHSILLTLYSGWTWYNTWMIFIPHLTQHGFFSTFCDVNKEIWIDKNVNFWMTHFYISKFYEFIDTWIILLKGRQPMFLQIYHHAGVVIAMWALVVTQCTGGTILMILNSFIHTLMYTYYTLAAYGYHSPLKHYLTEMQLFQFVFGIFSTALLYFQRDCLTEAQVGALAFVQIYAVGLIYLFGQFYVQSYLKKKDDKKKEDKKK